VRVDPAGNIFGLRAGSEKLPILLFGSHIDSVLNPKMIALFIRTDDGLEGVPSPYACIVRANLWKTFGSLRLKLPVSPMSGFLRTAGRKRVGAERVTQKGAGS
jgi:hypothetical protein